MTRRRQVAASSLALLLATLCVVLLVPGGAGATATATVRRATPEGEAVAPEGETTTTEGETSPTAGDEGGAEDEGAGGLAGSLPRPQLLLIHGGSFLYDDPYFEPLTRDRAIAAGFVPHYVTYPLGNLPEAVDKVREEAARLRQKFGLDRVYAYGSSAGGTLTALLSGDNLVAAAVAKAPISDLRNWAWPTEKYGPEYWTSLGVDEAARARLSPYLRPQKAPLLVIQGRGDHIVPPTMNEAFAARFKRVSLWLVAGGHTTERVRPFLITRAFHWLARIAARNEAAARKSQAAH